MPKNIVLCSDGTGNSTIKDRGTNVYKLYEAVDLVIQQGETPQVVFYDDGVGTGSLKTLRALGGAFGFGFTRNIRDLYSYLCRCYEPGDSIYLFGFSRGAYTVRALGGMIANCGILNANTLPEDAFREAVSEAYDVYRLRYRPDRSQADATKRAEEFRRRRGVHQPGDPVRITFIGVWDTVGAVGLPDDVWLKKFLWILSGFRIPWFKHYHLGQIVDRACHALSVDDQRQTFAPVLWDRRRTPDDPTPVPDSRLDQVWFAGVHSNVGGGYVKEGMSLEALDWMMRQARASGLRFSALADQACRERKNVHDKLYDSRSGLGTFYRYLPRDVKEISTKFGIDHPRVHASVFDRIGMRTGGYAPGNIPPGIVVVGPDRDRLPGLQAAADNALVAGLPLDSARGLVRTRRVCYLVTLISTIVLALWAVGLGLSREGLTATASALVSISGIAGLVWDLVKHHPLGACVLVALAGSAWLTSWRTGRRMADRFAEVWRPMVENLRPAS